MSVEPCQDLLGVIKAVAVMPLEPLKRKRGPDEAEPVKEPHKKHFHVKGAALGLTTNDEDEGDVEPREEMKAKRPGRQAKPRKAKASKESADMVVNEESEEGFED